MDQRASSLQQRLQARRDMFFNKDGTNNGAAASTTTASDGGNSVYSSGRVTAGGKSLRRKRESGLPKTK